MNRNFKKLGAMLLVLVMALSMFGTVALASPAGTGTLTIKSQGSVEQSFDGRTISAYKLFDITSVSGANVTYEVNPTYKALLIGSSFANITVGTKNDAEVNAELIGWFESKTAEEIKGVATALVTAIGAVSPVLVTGGTGATSVAFNSLDWGYYLITDTTNGAAPSSASFPILTSFYTATSTILVKSDLPTIEKTIDGDMAKSGEVGDDVDYVITGKVPNLSGFVSKYTYTITDTFDSGLTFNDDIVVKIDGTVVDGSYITFVKTIKAPASASSKDTFTLTIDVLKMYQDEVIDIGDDIEITYSAVINDFAVYGDTGMGNNAVLRFSNNPGDEDDYVDYDVPPPVVYSFGLTINKTDGAVNLKGASFQLTSVNGYDKTVTDPTDGTGTGIFLFEGLMEGTYTLTELVAPVGYKKLTAPITITVTATYDATGTLLTYTVSGAGLVDGDSDANDLGYWIADIVNVAGSELPGTGGMGTMLFTILGFALIGGAGVLLVSTKKRKVSTR